MGSGNRVGRLGGARVGARQSAGRSEIVGTLLGVDGPRLGLVGVAERAAVLVAVAVIFFVTGLMKPPRQTPALSW